MAWLDWFRRGAPAPMAAGPTTNFHNTPIADFLVALSNQTGPVSRAEALSVPAVAKGRNLICSIATLPLQLVKVDDNTVVDSPLLRDIDPDVTNLVTLSQTVEDLIFSGIGWWEVTAVDFAGFPIAARRVDPLSVSVDPPQGRNSAPLPSGIDPRSGVVYLEGRPVPASRVIRFDSPNPGVSVVGSRAIRRALLLDKLAKMYAEHPRPLDFFTPLEGAQKLTVDEQDQFLARHNAWRRQNATGWFEGVQYNTVSTPSPSELQLVELQRQATVEIANLFGIDVEEFGVSTTSRTYQNDVDRRKDRVNDVLVPYLRAIEQTLSKGNVTRRGYVVRFDLNDYMRSNPTERWAMYRTAHEIGVLSDEEIRRMEGLPPGAPSDPRPEQQTEEAEMSAGATVNFTADDTVRVPLELETFSVDRETRTIEGVAVPYGRRGNGFRFEKGALQFSDAKRVKLNREHDRHNIIGVGVDIKDGTQGLAVKFRVARTPEGDQALTLAEDGILDGLSVEVDRETMKTVPDPRHKNGLLVKSGQLRAVALTGDPAFDDARVTRVKLSKEGQVPDTENTEQTAPEPVAAPASFTADQVAAMFAAMNQPGPATTANTAPVQPERAEFVNPVRPVAVTQVADPASYRFDRKGALQAAAHDFGVDLIRAVNPTYRDEAAHKRVMEWTRQYFDVQTGDVNELNPTIQIPKYVDEREYLYPMFSATNRGTPPNGVQPFAWRKFDTATGLVATHSEASEPSTGSFVTTGQTVTPTALSGKASVTREVWDMGGTPGMSDILWRKVRRDWFETIEAAIKTLLDASGAASIGSLTTGGGTTGQTLVSQLVGYLAALQYVRGGFSFDNAFAQGDLYAGLVGARDTAGRPLLPILGAQNAVGDAGSQWGVVTLGSVPFFPAWALGAATNNSAAGNSYLIDRLSVDSWATQPQQLIFDQTEVRYVHVGVWGYHAHAVNDVNGVRKITYITTTA